MYLYKRGNLDTETDTQGECHVMKEAEIGVLYLQVNECQRLPTATRSKERVTKQILPEKFQEKPTLANTSPQTVRE